MAHLQKSIRDHARNRSQPNIDNKVIAEQLEDLVKPCVYNQQAYYRSLGDERENTESTSDGSSTSDFGVATSTIVQRELNRFFFFP